MLGRPPGDREVKKPLLLQASSWSPSASPSRREQAFRAACPAPNNALRGGRALLRPTPCEIQWVLLFMCLLACYTGRENQKRLNLNQNLCIHKCIKNVESSRKTPLHPRPTFTVKMRVGEGRGEGQFEFHFSCFCIN